MKNSHIVSTMGADHNTKDLVEQEEEEYVGLACPHFDEQDFVAAEASFFDLSGEVFFSGIKDDHKSGERVRGPSGNLNAMQIKQKKHGKGKDMKVLEQVLKYKDNARKDTNTESNKKKSTTKAASIESNKKTSTTKAANIESNKKTSTTEAASIESNKKTSTTKAANIESNKKTSTTKAASIESIKKTSTTKAANIESNKKTSTTKAASMESNKKTLTTEAANIESNKKTSTKAAIVDEKVSFEHKFNLTKRKLHESYEQIAKDKKRRQIQVLSLSELPKFPQVKCRPGKHRSGFAHKFRSFAACH